MKKILLVFILVFISKLNAQEENRKYLDKNPPTFEVNETVSVFGDNVKLRSQPNTSSETQKVLKIGDQVTILQKEESTHNYNGINWNWYKVKHDNTIGYVIAGLLSLDTKQHEETEYLASLKKKGDDFYIIIRAKSIFAGGNFENGKPYIEHENIYNSDASFVLNVFGDRGVKEVENMLFVEYMPEGCGIRGGGYYLFLYQGKLVKAIELYEMSDAGIFWNSETVVFPNDKDGIKDKILFKSEHGETLDETMNRTRVTTETCHFTWQGKELKLPEIKE